jgi:hypothetical protein
MDDGLHQANLPQAAAAGHRIGPSCRGHHLSACVDPDSLLRPSRDRQQQREPGAEEEGYRAAPQSGSATAARPAVRLPRR